MSVKTTRYHKTVEKIHNLEIQSITYSVLPEDSEVQDYPEFKIHISSGVSCFQSKLSLKEIPTDEILEDRVTFEELTEEEIFEVEDVSASNWRYSADEEDNRFGDSSVNTFASALINLFGGNVRQQLAFDSGMD